MAQKSGHIYIVDHEPSEEEVAGFAKPVEFYVSENGKYYSILYDKNGNKYVQDASKVVTGFLKIGEITQSGNIYTIGVHPSGFNHWRINGVDITSANPSVLEVEPVSDGKFRVDYIVGNSGGGLFILPGEESKFPTEINPLDYPSFAFFQRILVTPDGLDGGGADIDLSYEVIQSGSSTNFSINYDGEKTRFRVITQIDIPKTLQFITFPNQVNKALEFIIFNGTNLNINVPASASVGLNKGFAELNAPFVILPKSYAKLKYNPETDLIECWRVNSAGFALPVNGGNGDVLEKDSSVFGGAKWVDRLSGLTANLLPFWNGSKLVNSSLYHSNGNIGIGNTNPTAKLHVTGNIKGDKYYYEITSANTDPLKTWTNGTNLFFTTVTGENNQIVFAKDLQFSNVIEINSATITLSNSHKNRVLLFTVNCIVTIPTGLDSDFNCAGTSVAGVAVTLSPAVGVAYEWDGSNLIQKGTFSILPRATNSFLIKGDLI